MGETHSGDPAAEAGGEKASWAAKPRAEVEDPGALIDAAQAAQGLDGGQTSVVVLVQVKQVLGAEGRKVLPPAGKGVEDLALVDRVPVVEVHDLSEFHAESLSPRRRRWKP